MNENPEILSAQAEDLLEMYPRGARAIGLLVAGRNLVARFMSMERIGGDECRAFIRDVDFILGPLERTDLHPSDVHSGDQPNSGQS